MSARNQDIKAAAKEAGVYLWQVAEAYGLADSTFSRMLRRNLPGDKKMEILELINELKSKEA